MTLVISIWTISEMINNRKAPLKKLKMEKKHRKKMGNARSAPS